jgi:hypothetical protein
MLFGAGRSVPVNTGASSWDTPIAATPDRPVAGLGVQVGPHDLDLAVVLAEPHHRDVIVLGEAGHRFPERRPDLVEEGWRGNRVTQMPGQERNDLPTDLEIRHVGVEIDPIGTVQVQHHMAVEHVVDRDRARHCHRLQLPIRVYRGEAATAEDSVGPLPATRKTAPPRPTPPPTSAVRGWPHWMIDAVKIM